MNQTNQLQDNPNITNYILRQTSIWKSENVKLNPPPEGFNYNTMNHCKLFYNHLWV